MTDPREPWLQRVRYTAAEPTAWLNLARTLRQAAEDLWTAGNAHQRVPGSELGSTVLVTWTAPDAPPMPDMGGSTRGVCFMLFGFALENLAKGIIVCRDPKCVGRSRLDSWRKKGHKLVELFEWAGIPVTDDERDVLNRTSRMIAWKGRYPVPLNFDDMTLQDPVIGYVAATNIWPADDYAKLSALFDKAKTMIVQTMQDVPPLPPDYDFG